MKVAISDAAERRIDQRLSRAARRRIEKWRNRWIPLRCAVKLFPKDARGRYPNVATLYRWSTAGRKGVKLPTWLVGRCRCTTADAVAWFVDQLTRAADLNAPPPIDGQAEAAAALERLQRTVFRRARGEKE